MARSPRQTKVSLLRTARFNEAIDALGDLALVVRPVDVTYVAMARKRLDDGRLIDAEGWLRKIFASQNDAWYSAFWKAKDALAALRDTDRL